ncbi:iron complex transport system ATP-binding protein [Alteribacillus persepolensis]|uniref:Iron complex transport system ATP-binding protein n=1 Tax=Alteribacillus persepolensis TaxID=568899 RepID=A0A1G7YZV9_9BACI|nr:ABC transporter ATP-binding protein [Alteribacillus persepolensis]SDH01993.1 iron complex transport system ATP-binding protein [Alteribacillus persepolensis]
MTTTDALLRFDEVNVTTGGTKRLQNLSFAINRGEHWGVLGLNGSGKTTLLKVIAGYVWASKGQVTSWQGTYGKIDIQQLRQKIGWVSDSLDDRYRTKMSHTALEVVLSGLYASIGLYESTSQRDISHAEHWLDFFGISHVKHQPYGQLSQGEKKRALLARAWIAKPTLLLLDEPCTGLDVKGREEFLSTLEGLLQLDDAPTLLYVTHHLEELPSSIENVLLLKNGEILQQGKKFNTLTADNIQEAFQVNADIIWENERPWLVVSNS